MVFKSFSNLKAGFTFVELIVIIAIIAILTGISYPYYNSTRNSLALERAGAKLVQDMRRAQELAISGQEFSGSFPSGGYGVYFDKNAVNYAIFADVNSDGTCANNCSGASAERFQLINFENNIKITNIGVGVTKVNTIFIPPNPDILFTNLNGADMGVAEVTIKIALMSDGNKYKEIKINRAGLVWIE